VGLNAHELSDMGRLVQLVANPGGTSREDIYLSIASLYRTQAPQLSERERGLMREILQRLAKDVEMAIRISLAEKLADDSEAPLDLILLLVDDKIEVARPIILRSRRLSDAAILSFLAETSQDHQAACAARPEIGEPVTDALVKSDAEPVLVALVRNATARIGAAAFETLVEKSRRIAAIQEPLVRRDDLPATLATQMCGWVSDALKSYIVHSHRIAPDAIASVLSEATHAVQQSQPAQAGDASAQKLVDKLAVGGQLRAGFLLRVLHQGQMDMFDVAFAKLLNLNVAEFRAVFYRGGPRAVALACRAVGIDKCVFQTVFDLSRRSRGMLPAVTNEERHDVDGIFSAVSKTEAADRLHCSKAA
jgi:uncharacterized protein (DUF2336 family)